MEASILLWVIAALAYSAFPTHANELVVEEAVCRMRNGTVKGDIRLYYTDGFTRVIVSGTIRGLTPGDHGLHVHTYGDLANGCRNAGPHYNPFNLNHGGLNDVIRHVGDLGNVDADSDGIAEFSIGAIPNLIYLNGATSVVGRSLVIHANEDDLGDGGDQESRENGNSGPRIGCYIIGIDA